MQEINHFGLTFTGRRTNNQDAFVTINIDEKAMFCAVADGMGGAAGGEVASKLAIETAVEFLQGKFKELVEPNSLKSILEEMFLACQDAITRRLEQYSELTGMGTTLTCILIYQNKYVWGNIGDSRLYKLANGKIMQLTRDHTFVEEYREKFGNDIPDHVAAQSNVITRAIDGRGDQPDIFPSSGFFSFLNPGDLFIICSDGLIFNKVEDKNTKPFYHYITGTNTLEEACKQLIALAFRAGSSDNITIVLISSGKIIRKRRKLKRFKYPPQEITVQESLKKRKRSPKRITALIMLFSFLIIVTGGIFFYFFWKPAANSVQSDIKPPIIFQEQKPEKSKNLSSDKVIFENFPEFPDPVSLNTPIYWYSPDFPELLARYKLQLLSESKFIGKELFRDNSTLDVTLSEFEAEDQLKYIELVTIRLTPEGISGVKVDPVHHDFIVKIRK